MDWTGERQRDKEDQNGKEQGIVCEVSSHTRWHRFNLGAKRRPEGSHTHTWLLACRSRFTVCTYVQYVCVSVSVCVCCFILQQQWRKHSQAGRLHEITTYESEDSLIWQVYVYVCILCFTVTNCWFYRKTCFDSSRIFFSSIIVYNTKSVFKKKVRN